MISFVIPLHNEQDTLATLYDGIAAQMEGDFEVIFIDDGSTDASYERLLALKEKHPETVRLIQFRRNFGKSAGLSAGFAAVRGEVVFTMDADLQDDPTEIPNFLAKLDEGWDLVSGWKRKRHDPWHKTLPSRLFNAAVSRSNGLHLHDYNCGFKAYRRAVIDELNLYGEMYRFIPAFAHSMGFRVCEIPVQHHPRRHGVSKFGMERLYRGLFDAMTVILITKYFKKPLHFFGGLGALVGGGGFAILLYLSALWSLGTPIEGRPLFFAGILGVLAGVHLLSIGLIGELFISYMGKRKPFYFIAETHD